MDSEDVQQVHECWARLRGHLRAALREWDTYVAFIRVEEPGQAFDYVGDPPRWVREVRQILESSAMIGLLLAVWLGTAWAGDFALPDPHLTPGVAVEGMTTEKVCGTKWGLDRRQVTAAMNEAVCQAYGAKSCPGPRWEIDHLVPRELGGSDDVKNLWPQPIAEARVKDRAENWLRRQVCNGTFSLGIAQATMRTDWTTVLCRERVDVEAERRVQPACVPH